MPLEKAKIELNSLKTHPELVPVVNTLFMSFKDHLETRFEITPYHYTGSFLEEIEKYVQKPNTNALVLFEGEVPVGCVAYKGVQAGKAEIKRLYVLPSTQGKGYGRYLMEAVIKQVRAEQVYDTIWLETAERFGLTNFYQDLGFQAIPPYCEKPDDGIIMLYFELKF